MGSVLLVNRTRANAEALASAFDEQQLQMKLVAANAAEARSVARESAPEVAVIELDVATGLRLVRDLLQLQPALTVFVYGSLDDDRETTAWAEAGAACIVMRSVPLADLVRSVCDSVRGDASLTATTAVVQRAAGLTRRIVRDPSARWADLTQRERDVLRLIGLGLTNREVAETLCLELPTVKNHVQHLMRKLGVHRRADAARYLGDDERKGAVVTAVGDRP